MIPHLEANRAASPTQRIYVEDQWRRSAVKISGEDQENAKALCFREGGFGLAATAGKINSAGA
jgi:hypothetical protein